jgi:GNAT superfamily N-acetyltransferase
MAEVVIERLTEATADAAEQIATLLKQLTQNAQPLDEARLKLIVISPGGLYVARDGDKIVGTVTRLDMHHPVRTRCWIDDMVVDEAYRGQGIARRLMERAIDEAPSGAASISLNSNIARVESHRLYGKLGFEVREDTRIWLLQLPRA